MTISEDLDQAFAKAEHRMMIGHRLTPKEFVQQHLKGKLTYVTYWRASKSDRSDTSDESRVKNLRHVEDALYHLDQAKERANGPV